MPTQTRILTRDDGAAPAYQSSTSDVNPEARAAPGAKPKRRRRTGPFEPDPRDGAPAPAAVAARPPDVVPSAGDDPFDRDTDDDEPAPPASESGEVTSPCDPLAAAARYAGRGAAPEVKRRGGGECGPLERDAGDGEPKPLAITTKPDVIASAGDDAFDCDTDDDIPARLAVTGNPATTAVAVPMDMSRYEAA